MNAVIADKLELLSSSPGVYKMFDEQGEVIYVGKAKVLKNRVRQYFQVNKNHTPKVLAMISHIADFETIEVHSEAEALSLESNLIKQFMPKYNILLKDDKQFPYFRIDLRQDFPRIDIVRRVKQDGATYLGPYIVGASAQEELRLVYDLYPIRHCKKSMERAIHRQERPCLLYHIGKCCAPCSGAVTRAQYHAYLHEIVRLLDGKADDLLPLLDQKMQEAAEALQFERAAMLRDKRKALLALREKQVAISTKNLRADVFACEQQDGNYAVFALYVRHGSIVGTHLFPMTTEVETEPSDVLYAFFMQYYGNAEIEIPPVLLCAALPTDAPYLAEWLSSRSGRKVQILKPQRGEKRLLTDMASQNCIASLEKNAALTRRAWERDEGAVERLAAALDLDTVPTRIECFDNSHLMGTNTVSSMVVFTNGKADKQAYRHYRIRTAAGGDDLAAMREALSRRFEKQDVLPDLLILDGGKEQLKVGVEVLREQNLSHIPICALAESEEWLYLPNRDEPIVLPRADATLHLVQRIRDEAHRFAISYHRNLRSKSALYSQLDNIAGVGDKRKRALFDAFLTIDAIKTADVKKLLAVKGMTKPVAEAVYRYFHEAEREPQR